MTEDFLPYGTSHSSPDTSFEAQYKRIFAAAKCKTQVALANLLEIKQSSISDAKRRRSIPSAWLVKLFEKKRINPEWVRSGVEPVLLDYPEPHELLNRVVKVTKIRPPEECSSQDLFTELVRRTLEQFDLGKIHK